MGKENTSRYAILGVLSRGPMSGYALKKFIELNISTVNCADEVERRYALMTLSYGRYESQALRAWCDETLAILNMLAEKEPLAKTRQKER